MIIFGSNDSSNNQAPFIFQICDTIDNELSVVVSLSHLGKKGDISSNVSESEAIKELLKNAYPIEPDEDNKFEIVFEEYMMYQTLNESYCAYDEYDIGQGKHFVILERSHLLDHIKMFLPVFTASRDDNYYPYKPRHFRIISQNHVLEIIADKDPIIREIIS